MTVTFTITNPAIVAALEADRWGGFFQVELVTPSERSQCFAFDKLRFTGATYAQPDPAEPEELPPGSGSTLFGFESAADWAAPAALAAVSSPVASGSTAVQVAVQG